MGKRELKYGRIQKVSLNGILIAILLMIKQNRYIF